MMPLVETAKGMIDRELLVVKDIIEDHDNARSVATEWYLNGELVRRDCAVSILRTVSMGGEQAAL